MNNSNATKLLWDKRILSKPGILVVPFFLVILVLLGLLVIEHRHYYYLQVDMVSGESQDGVWRIDKWTGTRQILDGNDWLTLNEYCERLARVDSARQAWSARRDSIAKAEWEAVAPESLKAIARGFIDRAGSLPTENQVRRMTNFGDYRKLSDSISVLERLVDSAKFYIEEAERRESKPH